MSTLRSNGRSKAKEVRKLYEGGFTVREIARALDISTQGVYWHLDRLELPPPSERGAS